MSVKLQTTAAIVAQYQGKISEEKAAELEALARQGLEIQDALDKIQPGLSAKSTIQGMTNYQALTSVEREIFARVYDEMLETVSSAFDQLAASDADGPTSNAPVQQEEPKVDLTAGREIAPSGPPPGEPKGLRRATFQDLEAAFHAMDDFGRFVPHGANAIDPGDARFVEGMLPYSLKQISIGLRGATEPYPHLVIGYDAGRLPEERNAFSVGRDDASPRNVAAVVRRWLERNGAGRNVEIRVQSMADYRAKRPAPKPGENQGLRPASDARVDGPAQMSRSDALQALADKLNQVLRSDDVLRNAGTIDGFMVAGSELQVLFRYWDDDATKQDAMQKVADRVKIIVQTSPELAALEENGALSLDFLTQGESPLESLGGGEPVNEGKLSLF